MLPWEREKRRIALYTRVEKYWSASKKKIKKKRDSGVTWRSTKPGGPPGKLGESNRISKKRTAIVNFCLEGGKDRNSKAMIRRCGRGSQRGLAHTKKVGGIVSLDIAKPGYERGAGVGAILMDNGGRKYWRGPNSRKRLERAKKKGTCPAMSGKGGGQGR